MYCIKMKRSEPEFWNATYRKVVAMIDMYADEASMKTAATEGQEYESKYFGGAEAVECITSMREMEGFQ